MAESYIISIDQSTQGTKALLFDQDGMLLQRKDLPHKQMINEKGWVSHDPEEIYQNAVQVVKNLVEASGISKESVKGIGISNQRETSLVWEKETGKAIAHAVVWQCARAAENLPPCGENRGGRDDPEKDRACAFAVFSGFETGMAERKCRRCRSAGKETCPVFWNNRYLACIPDDTWNVL